MSEIETCLREHGAGIGFGIIAGIALVIALVIVIAASDRRPPDRKDDP
jgi:hypothetical protein